MADFTLFQLADAAQDAANIKDSLDKFVEAFNEYEYGLTDGAGNTTVEELAAFRVRVEDAIEDVSVWLGAFFFTDYGITFAGGYDERQA